MSKWERGDGCPDVGILPALAEALGTDVDSLLKGELKEVSEKRRILTEEELKAEIAKMEENGTLEKKTGQHKPFEKSRGSYSNL